MGIVEFAKVRTGTADDVRRGEAVRCNTEADLKTLVDSYERKLILRALTASGGHQRRAAAQLRVLPTTLNEKIRRLGICLDRVDDVGSEHSPDRLLWRGHVAAGGTLELRSLGGPVHIDRGESALVEVAASRSATRTDKAPLVVRVIEHRYGVSLSVARSGAEVATATDDAIELLVRVPAGVDVAVSTRHGDVEVVGLSGNVEAATANGHVIVLPATRSPAPDRQLA